MRHLKQEFDKLTFKETLAYCMGMISLAAAIVLLFMGLMIDPEGEIHPSVLYAAGLMLMFVAAILGISLHYGSESDKFKAEIMSFLQGTAKNESEQ